MKKEEKLNMKKEEIRMTPAETIALWEHEHCEDPIHQWFGLSYANYLVIPRTLLQSLSKDTQLALCRALEAAYREESEHCERHWPHEATIHVQLKDVVTGKYIKDPLANYERGRRRLW